MNKNRTKVLYEKSTKVKGGKLSSHYTTLKKYTKRHQEKIKSAIYIFILLLFFQK
jgi:hypothetical protein